MKEEILGLLIDSSRDYFRETVKAAIVRDSKLKKKPPSRAQVAVMLHPGQWCLDVCVHHSPGVSEFADYLLYRFIQLKRSQWGSFSI